MACEAVAMSPSAPSDSTTDQEMSARRAFLELEDWCRTGSALDLPLHDVERQVVEKGREVLRLLLQQNLDARGSGRVGRAIQVEGGEEDGGQPVVLSHVRPGERKQRTTLGAVGVSRISYSFPGEQSVSPLDEELQLPDRIYSYELQRHLVRESVKGPFDEAVDSVREFTGEKVPKRSAEELMEKASVDFEAFYAQRTPPPPSETSQIVVATADCKGIPMIPADRPKDSDTDKPGKKKMAIITGVYTVAPRPRTPEDVLESLYRDPSRPRLVASPDDEPRVRPEHKQLAASLKKGKDKLFAEMAEEVERRDPDKAKIRVALTDGEKALQGRMRKELPGATLVLDLLHGLGYVHGAAKLLHPNDAGRSQEWSKAQTLRILKGQVSQVVRGIRQSVTKRGLTGKVREDLLAASNYLYRNRHFMRYDSYLAQGLPIATGVIEGACKNLVCDRMERSGMSWSAETAEAMVKLRAVYLSGDFDVYWRFHIQQEQQRLHPKGRWMAVHVVEQE